MVRIFKQYFYLALISTVYKFSNSLPIVKTHSGINIISSNTDGNCPKIDWKNLSSGSLYSPNFPENYPNNVNCTYFITVGLKVKKFLPSF